ncbi:hypothetical protein [Lacinutrix algicola]|uniref:hypothetical protein n=1 Tax=Lacinutrix algicola TaxID=342954 RepID=UPI0006E24A4B|nr:hypothetical protein [Lacinutrix algicola]
MEKTDKAFKADAKLLPLRRRGLLPWWIRFFSWFFMITGGLAVFGLIAGFFNISFSISLYGLEETNPHSLIGLLIIILFIYKGVTSYGLLFEKDWAIIWAKIDAVFGIFFCVFSMFVLPFLIEEQGVVIRLEIALLIPYLLKVDKIKTAWHSFKTV